MDPFNTTIAYIRDGQDVLPLSITTKARLLKDASPDIRNKYTLQISAQSYVIHSDFIDSIHSALPACRAVLNSISKDKIKKFNRSIFDIKLSFPNIRRPFSIRGKSSGLALAVSILSCSISQIDTVQDISFSGEIDNDANIFFVKSLSEKINYFLDFRPVNKLIVAYPVLQDENIVNQFYDYLNQIEPELEKRKKAIILCPHLLSTIPYIYESSSELYRGMNKKKRESVRRIIEAYDNPHFDSEFWEANYKRNIWGNWDAFTLYQDVIYSQAPK